jgi:hypothetical protein
VHGDISENIRGPSQYNEALKRLGLYRGSKTSPPVDADEWHHQFFLDRSQMMEAVNVNNTSSSLWVYSMLLDHVAH